MIVLPVDIKFYPQPIISRQSGGLGKGSGGPISESQRRTISGIVFERYALHLLGKFLENKGIQVVYNESLVKFLEGQGFDLSKWWYISVNNWLLFFSKMPFYELYGYSISDSTFERRFGKSKPRFWMDDRDRKTAMWLLNHRNVSKIEISPLGSLLRREDFLLVAEFGDGLLVSPMDAKYRSASTTWLTPQDLRRLHIYYKLLGQVLHRRIYPYVVGNRESFSSSILAMDEEGKWVRSNRYGIYLKMQSDELFGNVETVEIYAHPRDDPDASRTHGRFLFSFRYIPIDRLQSALGVDEKFVHVIIVPHKEKGGNGTKIKWEWHAVSTEANWLPRYSLNAPQWGLDVEAYEIAAGHLKTGNYELFSTLEQKLRGKNIIRIRPVI